ncbi:hypothetical protein AUJ66_04425 [Candidatus Desantisbacteria bacterium CG1_02_38_46]|uniref:Polymerase beta nucleotidyltransferase domain-containing protein n=1 Tax=Candidatus Desantisbacteria bacterium CG1_02_38_46 TaxID=1817893 RepID=A0A1J4SCT6_9BACT|nr:MAG: hypothetical protein AUJ66_04425 [Candidatus Desantisbacteria bacterium CG1_02_38_46]
MKRKINSYRDAWKKRWLEDVKNRHIKSDAAEKAAKKISLMLIRKFKVNKIILFGSVIKKEFDSGSDIDLAVEGLKKEFYIKALVEAENLVNFPVDIKPLEECKGFFKEQIQTKGRVLYEK